MARALLWVLLLAGCPPRVPALPAPVEPAVTTPPYQARSLFLRGEYLLAHDDLEAAAAAFAGALALDPRSPHVRLAQADLELRRGELGAARQRLVEATEVAPDLAQPWLMLARVERLSGETGPAAEHYRRAVEAGADWAARAGLVDMLLALDRAQEAGAAVAQWAAVPTEDPYALAERGSRRLVLGDAEGALADLGRALDMMPENEVMLDRYVQAAQRARRYETALVLLERLSAASPAETVVVQRLYALARDVGDDVRALDALEHLLRLVGDRDPGLTLDRARLLADQGRIDEALTAADAMPRNWPGRAELVARLLLARGDGAGALAALGAFLPDELASRFALRLEVSRAAGALDQAGDWIARAGDRREIVAEHFLALGLLERARAVWGEPVGEADRIAWARLLQRYGWTDEALDLVGGAEPAERVRARGRILVDAGRPAEAVPLLQGLVDRGEPGPMLQHQLALALDRSGRRAEADAIMESLAQRWPDYAPALNHVGYALAAQGRDLDRALALTRRALDVEPGNGHYRDSVGFVLLRTGQVEEAVEELEHASRALPDDSEIALHLAQARAARGLP